MDVLDSPVLQALDQIELGALVSGGSQPRTYERVEDVLAVRALTEGEPILIVSHHQLLAAVPLELAYQTGVSDYRVRLELNHLLLGQPCKIRHFSDRLRRRDS